MITGHCNCGAVQFEITASPTNIYYCHCSICRRYTGANGIPVVVVKNADFAWIKGADLVTTWQNPDADWQAHFCPRCGSSLPGPNDPERMFVPVGALVSGTDDMQIAHHIFTGSKADWDDICDAGQQHDGHIGS